MILLIPVDVDNDSSTLAVCDYIQSDNLTLLYDYYPLPSTFSTPPILMFDLNRCVPISLSSLFLTPSYFFCVGVSGWVYMVVCVVIYLQTEQLVGDALHVHIAFLY